MRNYSKQYYQKHEKTIKGHSRKFYEKNKETIKEKHKKYYQENKEKVHHGRDNGTARRKHPEDPARGVQGEDARTVRVLVYLGLFYKKS